MEPKASKHASASEESTKKVYQRPHLEVYGDLRTITETLGNTGFMDGGPSMNTRP